MIFVTVLTAVMAFVIGQIIQRLFIEPIQDQRRIRGRIAHAITYYRTLQRSDPEWGQPRDESETAHRDKEREELADKERAAMESIRLLASELRATMTVIPFYHALQTCRVVMKIEEVLEVSFLMMKFQSERDLLEFQGAYSGIKRLLKMQTRDPEVRLNLHSTTDPNGPPLEVTLPGGDSNVVYLTSPNQGPWVEATPEEVATALSKLPPTHPARIAASGSTGPAKAG